MNENRLKMSARDMGNKIGLEASFVSRYFRKNNMSVPKSVSQSFRTSKLSMRSTFTDKEDEFIKANYLNMCIREIGRKLNRSGTGVKGRIQKLNLTIHAEILEARIKTNRYKKGNIPLNKGKKMAENVYEKVKDAFFKKGQKPHNTKPIGYESIRKDKSGNVYIFVKTAEFGMINRSVYVWFKQHGKVPKEYNIIHADGNTLNDELSNLKLVSNAELMKLNTIQRYPNELKRAIKLTKKLKNKIK